VQQLIEAGGVLDCPVTSAADILLETLMLGLRLADGLNLSKLTQKFGEKTVQQIWTSFQPYYQRNWVEMKSENGTPITGQDVQQLPLTGQLRLSDPEGFLFSNTILADVFSQLS
jgi:oxygen-independent coproporphyrinogen-3 oxidase